MNGSDGTIEADLVRSTRPTRSSCPSSTPVSSTQTRAPAPPGVFSHWEIFASLCRSSESRGNIVADAYLAALAIETGSEWITTDRDFSRFADLRWRHPLDP
jgi:hypothetical protein